MVSTVKTETQKLTKKDIARFNRLCFDRLGDEAGQEIIKRLEVANANFRSMLSKDNEGRIDPLAMAAKCGAYENISYLKQCIDFGSRNE